MGTEEADTGAQNEAVLLAQREQNRLALGAMGVNMLIETHRAIHRIKEIW